MLNYAALTAGLASYCLLQKRRAFCTRDPEYEPVKPIRCQDGQRIIPYAPPSRSRNLKRLKTEKFDVLVVGGGCVGAGVALDAAHKGLKTALIERDDFSAGTSGRSTKLIHGGIRYLETAFMKLDYGSYELVKEALEERAYMLNAAPYMNHPLPIMMPIYQWWEVPYYWVGTKVYDWVARKHKAVPSSHYLSKDEALFQFPMLKTDHLKGAIVYYDGQMNDTRMGLTVVLTATQLGAAATNRVELVSLIKDAAGKTKGARVRDTLTGDEWDVQAETVVNATGCFVDHIRKMDNPIATELVIPSAGVHIMLEDHFSPAKMGLIIPKTKDGRVLFFLPWEYATLAGTTDSATELTMLPSPTDREVDFILQEANRVLDKRVKRSDVKSAWSGIRPLVRDPTKLGEGTKALSRNHVIEVSDSGLLTVTGGKWTTYRRMADDVMKRLLKEHPELEESCDASKSTLSVAMVGADRAGMVCAKKFDNIMVTLRSEYDFPRDVAKHLVYNYGTRALQIAEIVRSGFGPDRSASKAPRLLSPKYPFIEAEVVFALRHEYALKAIDIVARRTRLAYIDVATTREVTPRVIQIMAHHLGWSKKRCEEEAAEVEELLATMSRKGESAVHNNHRPH